MVKTSRNGIGRIVAAVVVIVIVAIAGGVGIVLTSKGSSATSSLTSSSSTTTAASSSTTSTTSSSVVSTPSTSETSSTTTSNTTSSSTTAIGCVFSPPPPLAVNSSKSFIFTGCLTSGSSGVYQFGVTDPNGVVVVGAIRGQYPIGITIAGAKVGNLTAAGNGGIAFQANDTLAAGMPDLILLASRGYQITVMNEGGQNNTVILNITFIDEVNFVGG